MITTKAIIEIEFDIDVIPDGPDGKVEYARLCEYIGSLKGIISAKSVGLENYLQRLKWHARTTLEAAEALGIPFEEIRRERDR